MSNSINKGNILLEAVISLSLLLIFMATAISIEFSTAKIEKYDEKIQRYMEIMNIIEGKIYNSCTYEDILKLKNKYKWYINDNSLNYACVKQKNLEDILEEKANSTSNVAIDISGEDVLTIHMSANIKVGSRLEILEHRCYKAQYK